MVRFALSFYVAARTNPQTHLFNNILCALLSMRLAQGRHDASIGYSATADSRSPGSVDWCVRQ